jgi:hypothetical protein
MRMLILKNIIGALMVSLAYSEGAIGKQAEEASIPGMRLLKDTTANVKRRLNRLVKGHEECNPPHGNSHFPQVILESDTSDELDSSNLNEESMPVSEMPEDEDEADSHINETADSQATPVHFKMNRQVFKGNMMVAPVSFADSPVMVKANLISADKSDNEIEEESAESQSASQQPQPAPDPYDPTTPGTSKGGGIKGSAFV